ncbi:MAG TPA: glycoside hydrolase family 31 protein [Clostridia bacterium]|nr:glycoside hydrolase family 31 protein [Clostridia bacterium]
MIDSIERFPGYLQLSSRDGLLRIEPYLPSVVHITYTKRGDFSQIPGRIVLPDCRTSVNWNVEETDREVLLITESLQISVNRRTGALSYLDAQGNLLVKEPEREGRTLEEIEVFKTVYDSAAEVITTDGIDGIRSEAQGSRRISDRKAYHARLGFEWSEEEALFGLGSHEEGMMNLRGQHQYLYQENLKAVVPVLVSTKGYGILLDCQSLMTFHDDAYGSYLWCDVVEELDYYFIYGPGFDEIISSYRRITGQAPMLPKWAFGYMQSKERYRSQKELVEIAEEYRKRSIPLDTLVLDWQSWTGNLWGQKTLDPERFPDPDGMMERLHEMNVRLMISIWPNMSEGGGNYREFLEQGLLLGDRTHYDPFRKEGRELYWKQTREGLFRHGLDAWWCDCSEPFEADWRGIVKPEPEERMRINTEEAKKYLDPGEINAYSLLHSQAIYEGQRKATDQKRVVNLTRSSYAGQHRYSTITWSGDTSANWETLKKQIPAGLNFCASGEPYWTVDIGAFFVGGKSRNTYFNNNPAFPVPWFIAGDYDDGCEDLGYRELYVRWFQYGAFLPVFRSHGTGTPREIWRFGAPGEVFYDTLVKFVRLRYRLLPYIYSLAGMVTHYGYTMMRALAFDFREDSHVYNIADQYMFGPALMVCPVTQPMYYAADSVELKDVPKTRQVYFPAGCDWYDFWTGERFCGGQTVCVDAPLEIIPLYVRSGSVIPMGLVVQSTVENPDVPLELRIYPGSSGEFLLYDDAGDGYCYEKGDYSFTKLIWNDSLSELTVQPSAGNLALTRQFCAVKSANGENVGLHEAKQAATVQYSGNKVKMKV